AHDNVSVTGFDLDVSANGLNPTAPVGTLGWTSLLANQNQTNFTESALSASTQRFYRLRARDAAGNWSVYSTGSPSTTPPAADTTPPADMTLTAATVVNAGQINVAFNPPTDNIGATATNFQRATDAGFTQNLVSYNAQGATSPLGNGSGLNPASTTTYYYRAKAVDAAGNVSANWSNTVSATITVGGQADTTAPVIDSFTSPSQAQNSISLAWTAHDNISVTGYDLDWSTNGTSGWISLLSNSSQTSYSHNGLNPSTVYYYRLRATDAAGNVSGYTTGAPQTSAAPPSAPVINSQSPLPSAQTGQPYSIQLQKSGGTGSGSWSVTVGNLPAGALSANGLITISNVGSSNYTFTARFTDNNGTFVEKSFTIPVYSLAVWEFCSKYPLQIEWKKDARISKPRQGARQTRVDSPAKRKLTLTVGYHGRDVQREILAFWQEHYPDKNFLIFDDCAGGYFEAYISTPFTESRNLTWGGVELVIEEI
ncbi:MAG: fibronectin type III domain-containing protein, partial [Pyrinomonadaceae bacterium]